MKQTRLNRENQIEYPIKGRLPVVKARVNTTKKTASKVVRSATHITRLEKDEITRPKLLKRSFIPGESKWKFVQVGCPVHTHTDPTSTAGCLSVCDVTARPLTFSLKKLSRNLAFKMALVFKRSVDRIFRPFCQNKHITT